MRGLMAVTDKDIADGLMALARMRGPDTSFCPSEAARRLSPEWRALMPRVREVAARLPLRATQNGALVDPLTATGPIRLSLHSEGTS